jgi:hypothetical protein
MDILATVKDLEDMIGSGTLDGDDLAGAIGLLAGLRAGYVQGRNDAIRDATDQSLINQIRGSDD